MTTASFLASATLTRFAPRLRAMRIVQAVKKRPGALRRRHLDTIRKLVAVWAPPNGNDTEASAWTVGKGERFGIDEPLDLHDHACLEPILTTMSRVENGTDVSPIPPARINAALIRAGVMPPAARSSRRGRCEGRRVGGCRRHRS